MFKRYVYLLIFTGILSVILLFIFLREAYPPTPREVLVEEDFSQELKDVTYKLHTFDERQFLELTAERIVEYPHPQDTVLHSIRAWIYEEGDLFLRFEGERGYITSLRDRVQVEAPIFLKGDSTTFTCGYLLWEMVDGFIYGEEGVSYQDHQLQVVADRFHYDPGERRVYLKDNVRLSFKKKEE